MAAMAWPESARREMGQRPEDLLPRPVSAPGKISRQSRADQYEQPGGWLGHGENIELAEYIEGEPGEVGREAGDLVIKNRLNTMIAMGLRADVMLRIPSEQRPEKFGREQVARVIHHDIGPSPV